MYEIKKIRKNYRHVIISCSVTDRRLSQQINLQSTILAIDNIINFSIDILPIFYS